MKSSHLILTNGISLGDVPTTDQQLHLQQSQRRQVQQPQQQHFGYQQLNPQELHLMQQIFMKERELLQLQRELVLQTERQIQQLELQKQQLEREVQQQETDSIQPLGVKPQDRKTDTRSPKLFNKNRPQDDTSSEGE